MMGKCIYCRNSLYYTLMGLTDIKKHISIFLRYCDVLPLLESFKIGCKSRPFYQKKPGLKADTFFFKYSEEVPVYRFTELA